MPKIKPISPAKIISVIRLKENEKLCAKRENNRKDKIVYKTPTIIPFGSPLLLFFLSAILTPKAMLSIFIV